MSPAVWGICPVCGGDLIADRTISRWVHMDPRIADHAPQLIPTTERTDS